MAAVLVGHQHHFGAERIDPRDLPDDARSVDHRRRRGDALRGAAVDDQLARVGVGRVVQHLGRVRAHREPRLQGQQFAQALVLAREGLGRSRAAQPARPSARCAGVGLFTRLSYAAEVGLHRGPPVHRREQGALDRMQQGGQRRSQGQGDLESRVRDHQEQRERGEEDQLGQRRRALLEERRSACDRGFPGAWRCQQRGDLAITLGRTKKPAA